MRRRSSASFSSETVTRNGRMDLSSVALSGADALGVASVEMAGMVLLRSRVGRAMRRASMVWACASAEYDVESVKPSAHIERRLAVLARACRTLIVVTPVWWAVLDMRASI